MTKIQLPSNKFKSSTDISNVKDYADIPKRKLKPLCITFITVLVTCTTIEFRVFFVL